MTEIARIHWSSPQPTAVDEELVLYDDAEAILVVRGSRDGAPVIGTFAATVEPSTLAILRDQRREVDVRHPQSDAVLSAAEGVAAQARSQPVSTATFHAAAVGGGIVALQAVGGGTAPAEFELDPASVVVFVEVDGQDQTWHPMDRLATGFVSPEPVGLGGVGRPAEIGPGAYGTISLPGPPVTGPGSVSIRVAGTLHDDARERTLGSFQVRSAAVPLPTD